MAPLRAMTKEMMKKARATMPRDSRQVRPIAMMLDANCHVAALEAVSTMRIMIEVSCT